MVVRLWNWIADKDHPLRAVAAGGALSFALSTLANFGMWQLDQSAQRDAEARADEKVLLAERRAALAEKTSEIEVAASDFQTFAANYVQAVLDEQGDISGARKALFDNVMRQHSLAFMSRNDFGPEIAPLADQYLASLAVFSDALSKARTVTTMRPFWEAASDVLVSRNHFVQAIKDASRSVKQSG